MSRESEGPRTRMGGLRERERVKEGRGKREEKHTRAPCSRRAVPRV